MIPSPRCWLVSMKNQKSLTMLLSKNLLFKLATPILLITVTCGLLILACRFIKKCLGAPSDTDVEQLKADNEELKRQKTELEKRIESLSREVTSHSL